MYSPCASLKMFFLLRCERSIQSANDEPVANQAEEDRSSCRRFEAIRSMIRHQSETKKSTPQSSRNCVSDASGRSPINDLEVAVGQPHANVARVQPACAFKEEPNGDQRARMTAQSRGRTLIVQGLLAANAQHRNKRNRNERSVDEQAKRGNSGLTCARDPGSSP